MTDIRVSDDMPHSRLWRVWHWMRNKDDESTREYYSEAGIWSSRIYAVLLPFVVLITAWAEPPLGVALWLGMLWGLVSRIYLVYQARAVLAFSLIEERHANRDQLNSFLPVASIIVLLALWGILEILYYAQISTKTIDYTAFGWYVITIAAADVWYDLVINNRIMFLLSKVPARAEFHTPGAPHE